MLRKSYVRGVTKALLDTGAIKLAEEDAAEMADSVAEQIPEEAQGELAGEVPPEATAEIASTLMDLAQNLEAAAQSAGEAAAAAGGEGAPAGGAGPEASGIPPELAAAAAAEKGASLKKAASFLRQKFAMQRKRAEGTGPLVTGDKPEQQNTLIHAAPVTTEGALENQMRPEGYAQVQVGTTDFQVPSSAVVGSELITGGIGQVGQPGTNQLIQQSAKSASLRNMIKAALAVKRAEGSGPAVTGDKPDQQNTLNASAPVTAEGAMEREQRPEGYAQVAVGDSPNMNSAAAAATVGKEQIREPGSIGQVGQPGTNEAIDQSKVSEERVYIQQFKGISAKYAHVLPFWMKDGEKVASIQYFMGLSPAQRELMASRISKTAELPPEMKAFVENKKEDDEGEEGKDHEKKEDKDEEKKEDEKKEGSMKTASLRAGDLISRLRAVQTR
jgi:hypothetical protein